MCDEVYIPRHTMPSRAQIAKPDIVAKFDSLPQRVFSHKELATIMWQNRADWRLAQGFTTNDFIHFLTDKSALHEVVLRSTQYPNIVRYVWREASEYQIALSVKPRSYLSHGTAVFLHALNDQVPTVIFANREQSPKPSSHGILNAEALRKAFERPQRQSAYLYSYEGLRIQLLGGKYTGRLEVAPISDPTGALVDATKLERTLIDIAVRPSYAGGPFQVLEAYRRAKSMMSVNTLVATLRKMAFVYPYHQAIGFYMDRAGYEPQRVAQLQKFPINIDFYIAHGIKDKEFHEKWRLFYPRGL
jgi:hypothetical protein